MSKRTKSADDGDPGVHAKRSRSDPVPASTREKGAAAKPTFPAASEFFMQTLPNNHGRTLGHQVNWFGERVHLI